MEEVKNQLKAESTEEIFEIAPKLEKRTIEVHRASDWGKQNKKQ